MLLLTKFSFIDMYSIIFSFLHLLFIQLVIFYLCVPKCLSKHVCRQGSMSVRRHHIPPNLRTNYSGCGHYVGAGNDPESSAREVNAGQPWGISVTPIYSRGNDSV